MVTETTAVKQEVRLREWSAQVEAKQTSGLTVPQWWAENGINLNTYYISFIIILYHLYYIKSILFDEMPFLMLELPVYDEMPATISFRPRRNENNI